VSALDERVYPAAMRGRFWARAVRAGRLATGAALLVALSFTTPARAQAPAETATGPTSVAPAAPTSPPELTLAWQAPDGCLSAKDVEGQFVRLLGGDTRTPSGKHIVATATVRTSVNDHWVLELATIMDGAPGRRSLAGDSCASVASATALILALMIDPAAASRAAEADAVIPPPVALATRPTPTVVAVAAPPRRAPTIAPDVRAFGGALFSMLPTPAPAAGLALGAHRGRLGAELTFVATPERSVPASGIPNLSGDFRFIAGGARACGLVIPRAVTVDACLGAELEWLTGTGAGSGLDTRQSKTATMLAGSGGLLVRLPLARRLALTLEVSAALRPYHPTFEITGIGPLFRIPVGSALAAGGLAITL